MSSGAMRDCSTAFRNLPWGKGKVAVPLHLRQQISPMHCPLGSSTCALENLCGSIGCTVAPLVFLFCERRCLIMPKMKYSDSKDLGSMKVVVAVTHAEKPPELNRLMAVTHKKKSSPHILHLQTTSKLACATQTLKHGAHSFEPLCSHSKSCAMPMPRSSRLWGSGRTQRPSTLRFLTRQPNRFIRLCK